MARSLTLRTIHAQPIHPPQRRSANTIGMQTREDGARSRVKVYGFTEKDTLVEIEMSPKDALALLAKLAEAIEIVVRVNSEHAGVEGAV